VEASDENMLLFEELTDEKNIEAKITRYKQRGFRKESLFFMHSFHCIKEVKSAPVLL
jgi:hypothetical protein